MTTTWDFIHDYHPSFNAMIKSVNYKPKDLKGKILETTPNIRESDDYEDAKHCFIESTMSCTIDEAIDWMIHYAKTSIMYGIDTKKLDWKAKCLAAMDILKGLVDESLKKGKEWKEC